MTSSPVKEINSLMNFAPAKAKGNLQENLAGNFSDAFSKASGQQSMTLQKILQCRETRRCKSRIRTEKV